MQHPKQTFAGLACALTVAALAWPVVLPGAVGEQAANPRITLETVRAKVLANEARLALLRLDFRCYVTKQGDDPQVEDTVSRPDDNYRLAVFAQDGERVHKMNATYRERKLANSRVVVLDGEVCKEGVLPELKQGWITRPEKFRWEDIEPIRLSMRPCGRLMSDCLDPKVAAVLEEHVPMAGRDTVLVNIVDRENASWHTRAWIDMERGVAVRTEKYYPVADGTGGTIVMEPAKFHQLPNGGWIPIEGVVKMHRIRDGFGMDLDSHCTVDINSISIEKKDIPDSLFDVKFPPGADVAREIDSAPVETKPKSPYPRSKPSRPRGR